MSEAAEVTKAKCLLMNIISMARFEQEHPTDLHMTCFSLIEKQARAAVACIDAVSRAPEAPPAAVPGLEAIPGAPEGETGASGPEIGSTRDADGWAP